MYPKPRRTPSASANSQSNQNQNGYGASAPDSPFAKKKKMYFSQKIKDLIDAQILIEFNASQLYKSGSSWCEYVGYFNTAKFLSKHVEEERNHMNKLYQNNYYKLSLFIFICGCADLIFTYDAIKLHGLFKLRDYLPKKPTDVELKVIKEMFEASVDGEAFNMEKWGQYYRPSGMSAASTNE